MSKVRIGQFLFSLAWDRLRDSEKQMLKERIFCESTEQNPLVELYPEIFDEVDPVSDAHLYSKIK